MALLQPTEIADGGLESGSLRDLVLQANSTPEDDIIELQGGETYTLSIGNTIDNPNGETIDLGNGSTSNAETIIFTDEDRGELGDLDIVNNGTLTIRVVGEGQATIDASGIPEGDRVFEVLNSANLTLENIVITGGNALEGGGIFVGINGRLNLNNSNVENNTASEEGGGIVVTENGEINLDNSQINNNTASRDGGGIAIVSNATANISQSTISNNSSINISDELGSGGGIFSNGNLNIFDSTISGNSASRQGGGIIVDSTTEIPSALLAISNSNIEGNTTEGGGGGILVRGNNSTAEITNNNIINNQANTVGGGVVFFNGSQGTAVNNYIANNTADFAGGIDIGGASTTEQTENPSDVNLVNNTIANNIASQSGGGLVVGGIATFTNNTISGNSAEVSGGGAFIESRGQASFTNNTLTGNSANDAGGGINNNFGEVTIANSVIANSTSGGDFAGEASTLEGVNLVEDGSVTGESVINADPNLAPLEDDGSGTFAHALLSGSPAIDAGNNSSISPDLLDLDGDGDVEELIPIDQLSNERIFNDTVDLGAVEFGSTPADIAVRGDPEDTIYRFFNNDTGVHFYTADETERESVQNELPNFSFEGASYVGADPLTGVPEPSPVYRFLNQDTGVHLYTVSEAERDATQQLDNFSFEGEAFLAYPSEVNGSIPIYRFFNTTSGAHFYTPSAAERDNVEANLPDFQSEGIAYYALPIDE